MLSQELQDYSEQYSSAETELLSRIRRDTFTRMPYPRMLSGHLQGLLLQLISRMIKPQRVLEIGSFTGYSAICLAQGLSADGILDTIEINPELEEILLGNFAESGFKDRIRLHIGDATAVIDTLDESFDLVFLDADKENYLVYYHSVIGKVRPGGYILADNVLWGGKVLHTPHPGDRETSGIMRFNAFIAADQRVENLLLPFRDGIMMIRKL